MLLTTDDLSQNIAKKVGFDDVQNFSRQFKRIVGRPPKQFKRPLVIIVFAFSHLHTQKLRLH